MGVGAVGKGKVMLLTFSEQEIHQFPEICVRYGLFVWMSFSSLSMEK